MEKEGLLYQNTDTWMPCPGSYGFVSDLPEAVNGRPVRLKDCWCWADSQESAPISPAMFEEFYPPVHRRGDTALRAHLLRVLRSSPRPVRARAEGHSQPACRLPPWSATFSAQRKRCTPGAHPRLHQLLLTDRLERPLRNGGILGRNTCVSAEPTRVVEQRSQLGLLEKPRDSSGAARPNCDTQISFHNIYTINGDRHAV